MKKIMQLYRKYKSILSYLIFGVLTTVVNVAAYYLCYDVIGIENIPSTVVAWIIAVAFAFITNKLFVFESRSWKMRIALKEACNFTFCRLGTGVIELIVMYVFVDVLNYNGTVMKLISNIIVIILNYIASKLLIFRKK